MSGPPSPPSEPNHRVLQLVKRDWSSLEEGEEIVISYIGDTCLNLAQRMELLFQSYGFICGCPACDFGSPSQKKNYKIMPHISWFRWVYVHTWTPSTIFQLNRFISLSTLAWHSYIHYIVLHHRGLVSNINIDNPYYLTYIFSYTQHGSMHQPVFQCQTQTGPCYCLSNHISLAFAFLLNRRRRGTRKQVKRRTGTLAPSN